MKIVFFVRNLGKYFSATTSVLLRHAYYLKKKGYKVDVIVPADRGDMVKKESFFKKPNFSYKFRKFYNLIRGGKVKLNCEWMEVEDFDVPIIEIPDLSEKNIPKADIIVAGSSWMLDVLKNYSEEIKKFYLIQSYELETDENIRRYKLPVKKIAVSTYLKNRIEKILKDEEIYVVNNGVDVNFFTPKGRNYNIPPRRIGMVYYYKAPYRTKAVIDGIKAFELVKKEFPFVELVMFGTKRDKGVPEYAEFYEKPSRKKIAEIYRSCDIFLSPSREEACQLPPMEAMASGCALVATNVGGVPDYTIPGETALVCSPGEVEKLATNIKYLIENPDFFKKISGKGRKFIENFSWEKVSVKFEKILRL
ncbi:MAG: hypothetical protein B6D56_08500 [Candidatus Omnitrophica bacterium 4484_70.1]|nr:MAG: hypothetical protein B6D56_08500 [Candidatus Omnitrophica bacterium 4484_70.1]